MSEDLTQYFIPVDDDEPSDAELAAIEHFEHGASDEWGTPTEDCGEATPQDATNYLARFFVDKTLHVGGPIPSHLLFSERHIEIVRRLELSICMEAFHLCMEENKVRGNHVEMLMELLQDAREKELPKRNVGGLITVYLKLCKGLDI